jgi:fused signal recognition particle receptor
LIGTKRKRSGTPVKLPSTPALFAKVKIPPSRRLIERQVANYEVNLRAIRQNRARMRKTLSGILKIAREEHLSEEIVDMTDVLFQKCRDLKAEEEEQFRLKQEADAAAKAQEEAAKAQEEAERAAREHQSADGGEGSAEEPEAKRQRLNQADAASSNSSSVSTLATAPAPSRATPSSEVKGISSLLGSEDSDAKESSYSSAESKSRADNDEDSEGDLEQASRAIADITSSVMPDMSGGMLHLPPSTEKAAAPTSQGFASQGQFMIRGGQGLPDKRVQQREPGQDKAKASEQSRQSFLDQALEVLNKQQQQQQRLEKERQERERHEREQQRLEKQRQAKERREQQRRE